MPAGSIERTNARKEEIINACEKLYHTMSFKEITLKEISRETTFSRTSIYNYFQTKEEIFLALLKREYDLWILKMEKMIGRKEAMSMYHYDLEDNSRIELLTEFKASYGKALKTVMQILERFRPDMDFKKREEFIYSFFPFMFGIYPYTVVTEKQKEAMARAGVDYTYSSVYNLTFTTVKRLLDN